MKAFKVVVTLLFLQLVYAQTDADQIVATAVDSLRGSEPLRARVTMVINREDGEETYEIDFMSDGDTRTLIYVLAPANEAGTAFLRDGENLFLYNSRLKRVLRLPPTRSNDSFLSSDITYNDISGRDLNDDYDAEIFSEGESDTELLLLPKPLAPTPYGKVELTVDKLNSFTPLKVVHFDQRDAAVRQTILSDYLELDGGLQMPTHYRVDNLLQEGDFTVFQMNDVSFEDVDEGCFSQRALERGCN